MNTLKNAYTTLATVVAFVCIGACDVDEVDAPDTTQIGEDPVAVHTGAHVLAAVAGLGIALHMLLPTTVERLVSRALRKWHFDEHAEQQDTGNLYTPADEGASVRGERRPQISTPVLAGWAAQEFVKIQAENAVRWAERLGEKARKWPGSDKRDPLTQAVRVVP